MKLIPANKRLFIAFLICCWLSIGNAAAEDYARQRASLLAEVMQNIEQLQHTLGRPTLSPALQEVLNTLPRHQFVPGQVRSDAYKNRPLPIGHGQTISQPLIVAIMTELLEIRPGQRVFELGTGSGYQAAVLSALGAEVYSMEIIAPLGKRAERALDELGYNVQVRVGDGYHGWQEAAPFDAIIVTAAGDHIPLPLIQQLKPGGRMILPVGGRFLTQQLILVRKRMDGSIQTRDILPVSFVPLTGNH